MAKKAQAPVKNKAKPTRKPKSKVKPKAAQKSLAKAKQTPNKTIQKIKKTLFMTGLCLSFVFLSYLGYLDYSVRYQFEGKRWSIPAKVYASPVELYAGYPLSRNELKTLLARMNYHQDQQLTAEGSYYERDHSIILNSRSFKFWDKQQQSTRLKVSFSGASIEQIIDLDQLQERASMTLDPVQIGSFYPRHKEDRVLIKLEEAPDLLVQGLLVTEDKDFYHHYGISPLGIMRAMWANLRAGTIVQGGSTITQQLVKNLFLSSERKIWRKINEALMAVILDYRFQKDEILEAYLNEIYLGQDGARSIHGFGLASQFYFGRPLESLLPHQIATLVALVKGPSWYDPRRSPERLIARRNLVLAKMHEHGYITKRQLIQAKQQGTDVIPRQHYAVNRYPAFLDLVRRQLHEDYQDEDLTSEGLRIFTTLDFRVQDILENRIDRKLKYLEKKPKVKQLQTAVVVTRRDSGEIVALAGGRNSNSAGYNRVLDALRPIGSLIKPVVYLTALEYPDKYTISTQVSDTKIKVKTQKGQYWRPVNYDRKEHGDVALHTALSHSYNLATVRIGMDIGIARTAKTLRNMGMARPINLYPSLLLGATPMTPIEVTQIYQTLASDGFATPLRAIYAVTLASGEAIQRHDYVTKSTLDLGAAYITNTILQETMRTGTGSSAYQYFAADMNLAGKTGTTNDYKDSWFAGFSGDYLSVVWMGRDDNKSAGLTGSSGALQLWLSLMRKIAKQPLILPVPDEVERLLIDQQTGLLANQHCSNTVSYPYINGSAPTVLAPCATIVDNAPGYVPPVPVKRVRSWIESWFE